MKDGQNNFILAVIFKSIITIKYLRYSNISFLILQSFWKTFSFI